MPIALLSVLLTTSAATMPPVIAPHDDQDLASYRGSVVCFAEEEDADHDGYARAGAPERFLLAACPAGFVTVGGDCDDHDAKVHPFNDDIGLNRVDDDCDGAVDEPRVLFPTALPAGGQLTTMTITLNDAATIAQRAVLQFTLEVAPLNAPQRATTTQPAPLTGTGRDVTLPLPRGEVTTMYRARATFLAPDARGALAVVGPQSGWFYYSTTDQGAVSQARTAAITLALHEWDESERGRTGYRGSVAVDGTRYGADPAELWCSEYYAWVTKGVLANIAGRASVAQLRAYFGGFSADYPGTQLAAVARRGDYLAMDTNADGDLNHSGMFLAIEPATSGGAPVLWTVEGNAGNKTKIKRRPLDTRYFRLGHIVEGQIRK